MAKAIHVMVRVLDAEKSIDFYERAFGLTVADRFDFDDFTLARERSAQWAEEYERIAAQRDELAKELTATYPPIVNKLVDLFERIEAADKEVDCINGSAPSCDHRRLRGVELTARKLDGFTRGSAAGRDRGSCAPRL